MKPLLIFFLIFMVGCTSNPVVLENNIPTNEIIIGTETNSIVEVTEIFEIIDNRIIPESMNLQKETDLYIYNRMNVSNRIDVGTYSETIPANQYTVISVSESAIVELNGIELAEIIFE